MSSPVLARAQTGVPEVELNDLIVKSKLRVWPTGRDVYVSGFPSIGRGNRDR